MEDKNELSDIILEKDSKKILKAKRVLIIVALLIIVFLGVLVTMKLINKPTYKTTEKMILPAEPKNAQETKNKDEELFKQVPIIKESDAKKDDSGNKDNFDNVVKNLKKKEIQNSKINDQNQTTSINAKTITKKPITTVVEPIKKEVKKVVQPKKRKIATAVKNRGIFIQVGAVSKSKPSKKFLKLIESKKYSYILHKTTINGKNITKILIGPFKTESAARNNMTSIKKSINKSAYIYRIK